MSILKDSINGTATYSETHTATSDAFGVFSMVVGSGTVVSGSFSAISWGSASHFIKVEMDPAGGSNYQVMGVTQLLSVPYSMYADSAGNVSYSFSSNMFTFAINF